MINQAAVLPLPFEEDPPRNAVAPDMLVLNLEGYDGPIDILLAMAKDQKLDLAKISILQLADQYLTFIAEARRIRLELAADYLVMAAWLAYLKSRLLLPQPDDIKPSAEEMAEALTFQLKRLEAMQQAASQLMARPLLGRDVFVRGMPEDHKVITKPIWQAGLYDLLSAYGQVQIRQKNSTLHIAPTDLYSVEEALERLSNLLGTMPDWATLAAFLPHTETPLKRRSAMASTLLASLELAKSGRLELRQEGTFSPIFLKRV